MRRTVPRPPRSAQERPSAASAWYAVSPDATRAAAWRTRPSVIRLKRTTSGFLKLGTPFAMASLPVRPTEPDANARRIKRTVRGAVPTGSNGCGGCAIGGIAPTYTRPRPMRRMAAIPTM